MAEMIDDKQVMTKLLEGKTSLWLPLLSGSMAPFLMPGDQLFIEPKPKQYKIGDIAVFFAEGKFFSHRILLSLRFGKRHYLLEKGDANRHGRFISYDKALGIVTKMKYENQMICLQNQDEKLRAKKIAIASRRKYFMNRLGL